MIGKTYQIPQDIAMRADEILFNAAGHEWVVNYHARQLNVHKDRLWRLLLERIPELDAEKFAYRVERETKTVVCIGEKPPQAQPPPAAEGPGPEADDKAKEE